MNWEQKMVKNMFSINKHAISDLEINELGINMLHIKSGNTY